MELVSDLSSALSQKMKKSAKDCSKETGRLTAAISGFIDLEGFLRSIHRKTHPEETASRKTSIVHETIDWSLYPESAYRIPSQMRGKVKVRGKNNSRHQKKKEISKINAETLQEDSLSIVETQMKLNNVEIRKKNTRSKSVPSLPPNFHLQGVKTKNVDSSSSEFMRKRPISISSCRCARERRVSTSSCGSNCHVIYRR